MRRSGTGSGGGLGMNKNVQPKYRTGAPRRGVRPAGAAQFGAAIGSRAMGVGDTGYRGEKVFGGPALQSKLGNQIAAETTCGVGGSREIFKSGSQRGLTTRANNPRGRSFDD